MNQDNRKVEAHIQATNEPLKFVRDIIWVAVSQVFTSLLGIIILPALTKSYTTEIYGMWAQISVTVGLISPLLTMHFGSAVVRFLAGEEDKAVRRRSLGTMICAILIFSSLVFVVSYLFAAQLSNFLFANAAYSNYVRLTYFWVFFDALFAFFISYLRARGRIRRLSIIQTAFSFSKMALIVSLATSGLGLDWIITCMVFVELIFALIVLYLIIREEGFPVPNFVGIRSLLAFSLPQMPSGILLWIISASDRYFITQYLDLSQTGIYSSSNNLGGMITLFFSPISFVLFPAVSRAWEENQKAKVKNYFEYSIRLFLTLALPSAVGLAMLSQSILRILTTSEYLVGWVLVLLVGIGTMFLGVYQINLYGMYLAKQTKWLPLMILVASVTSAGMNIILIPRVGIIGAAISNIASYFVLAVVVTIFTSKAAAYRFDFKYLGKIIMATLIMMACLWFIKVNSVPGIILVIIVGVAVYAGGLLLMKAFSKQDKALIKSVTSGLFRSSK